MKTILCIFALLVLTASTADAYVRRAVGGGYVARGGGVYGARYAGVRVHPVARGAAVAAAGVAAGAAATGWGWNQPYYGGGYYGGYTAGGYPGYYGGYATDGGYYANRSYVTGRPTLIPRRYGW